VRRADVPPTLARRTFSQPPHTMAVRILMVVTAAAKFSRLYAD
jgi:hypothetical protein